MAISNDNFVVKDKDKKIKFQCTCYRLFIVYVVGNCSITSVLLQKAKKFGFYIALMTKNFRLYSFVGAEKDGNTMLKRKQYSYGSLDIAKNIIMNKINNQLLVLKSNRNKNDCIYEAIEKIKQYHSEIPQSDNLHQIMAYEGLSSKLYFKNHFNNILWTGRQPRLKRDIVNSVLDTGYTLLFSFIDAILSCYGFDTYCGVLHREFYMRKSLVCDIIEPFRPLIDIEVKKAINLKQINENDFICINKQYRVKWELSAKYIQILIKPVMEHKDNIFLYIQEYYRSFMKEKTINLFPVFDIY